MSILQISLSIPIPSQSLSSSRFFSGETPFSLLTKLSHLSLTTTTPKAPFKIQMGGGPRTYPGGVSKWQWKRMQAKKSKQLLKARLARERQIYEMRKRAELQAAVSELERPWEIVEKAPNLFSVNADEQVKVLADRFQRPGGFDLWSDKDGPELFGRDDDDGVRSSSRFFPKGVVHSVRPYGRIGDGLDRGDELGEIRVRRNGRIGDSLNRVDELGGNGGEIRVQRNGYNRKSSELCDDGNGNGNGNGNGFKGKFRKKRNRRNEMSSNGVGSNEEPKNGRISNGGVIRRSGNSTQTRRFKGSNSEVYDMNLQQDGSYEFQKDN